MLKRFSIFILLLLLNISVFAKKEIAITIDDLPFLRGRNMSVEDEIRMFREILSLLKKHDVKIVGFTNGARIKQHHIQLLDELTADGHVIGNHTSTHPDLNSTKIDWYKNDIINCDSAISSWVDSIRYFRYPYLHRGDTQEKYKNITQFLEKNSYTVVPVTIDNDECVYSKDFTNLMKEQRIDATVLIGQEYLAHMQSITNHFDSIATSRYKRDIKHILLLHMNELNSVYLDRLLTWYKENNWKFITVEEALTDEIYNEEDTYIGSKGHSWLLRY